MANTKKYVSLDKLSLYDEKIKKYLADADGVVLQSAKDYADGLATNYDAAGSANTALESAKSYADGKDTAIAEAKKAGTDAAAAAAVADGKAVTAQNEVDALEAYVGTFTASEGVDTVVKYIDAKTANIASDETVGAIADRVTQAEKDIDAIEADYLKKADKEELAGDIADVQSAVDAEKERAEGVESGLETRLKAVEDDYLKGADRTTLEASIKSNTDAIALLTNGVDSETVDGVNDLIQYVKDHGTEVIGMQKDISDNADAIAGVAGRMDTAEGKITAVEDAVATKVEQSVYNEKVEALEEADAGQVERIAALEAKFGDGEGSVADQIADAQAAAEATAAADATSKANAAEAAAKGHADSLNTAMNTRVEALEAIDHDHANKAELDLIAEGDKAKWDAAAGKAHEHSNLAVLEGITSAKVTAWDAAEGNAKTYADGLNTAMNTRVATLESWHENFVECSQEDIQGLFA